MDLDAAGLGVEFVLIARDEAALWRPVSADAPPHPRHAADGAERRGPGWADRRKPGPVA